ncbi:MAG TPA: FAD-dependent oxidoreductase [Candidatus Dormibacteraeota bacterium]|nr:FAD-dependent oxidoreductase [Candidatus Dormibacteraeota bacterium]
MSDVTVFGAPWCPSCRRAKRFLAEQRVPYSWVDVDADADGLRRVQEIQNGGRTIPTLVFGDGSSLVNPADADIARKLGLPLEARRRLYDLAIAGGGPAGLAAAMYAAREGIRCVVVDRGGLGGQAGVTERVDNYPGFPEGIGGAELADRFIQQARRYGVELLAAVGVDSIHDDGDICLRLSTGADIAANAVLLAPGSTYRRLDIPGEDDLIGAGVHFCATCDGPFYRGADELVVIGGGNSALEEGLFLTQFAKRVRIVQRGPELTASQLLRERVATEPAISTDLNTEVVELRGDGHLETIVVRSDGSTRELHPAAAFVFVGLTPNTEFLRGTVDLDENGFITVDEAFRTSMRAVYAAGDARHGSTKQLASAVGDGVAALIQIRSFLQNRGTICSADVEADPAVEVAT